MTHSGKSVAHLLTCVALLWLAGNGMRMTILAVPPLIPLIHNDLHMSETQVGILAGLPVVLFAFAAVPGSLLIARFGAVAKPTRPGSQARAKGGIAGCMMATPKPVTMVAA